MSNEIILVTGGMRSGKSRFAEQLLADRERKVYIATAEVLDDEMRARVAAHRARRGDGWQTVETATDLAGALKQAAAIEDGGVLIDCLTMWLNNLFMANGGDLDDETAEKEFGKLMDAAGKFHGTVVMVLNQVGDGIVPVNRMARRFCDVSGKCGQFAASYADRVYLVTCGIPMRLK